MIRNQSIVIGKSDKEIVLSPKVLNRHGYIAGATGTGKTVTLKVMAESLSQLGIPVFLADIKGDLSGLSQAGNISDISSRLESMGINDFETRSFPVAFWDVYGENGLNVKTTITEMGPLLLSKLLGLNDTQTAVLNIVFRVADENGWLVIDTKDLRSLLIHIDENKSEISREYGAVSSQSIAAIQRSLMQLEDQGGDFFFGEPSLNILDWMKTDNLGNGIINILDSKKLFLNPQLYSTFMLWMLSELFEILPEVGDLEKPKIVFFFDEAHTLFEDTSKEMQVKIEQVVKLIRSKGVGIFFVTQNPSDIPDEVLAQCSNRIQHALRAYTPKEQKGIKAAAESFRVNPLFDTEETLSELETGQALVSFLDESGKPSIVEKTMICPPQSSFGIIDKETQASLTRNNPLYTNYSQSIDRESAYEILSTKVKETMKKEQESKPIGRPKKSFVQKTVDNTVNQFSRQISRTIVRSVLGVLKGTFNK